MTDTFSNFANINLSFDVKLELNNLLGEINNENYHLYSYILENSRVENGLNTFNNIFDNIKEIKKIEINELLNKINEKNYEFYLEIIKNSKIENGQHILNNIFEDLFYDNKTIECHDFIKSLLDKIYENDQIDHTEPINIIYSISNNMKFYY
jgi:hypothetical protein